MTLQRRSGAEVRLEGIGKRYGAVTAVKPLDLVIEGGTLVTLLGPSGCGKTTLLRMIAGLELPSEGRIFIGGRDVSRLPAGERDVSLVFQSYALFPHMTVGENVAYGLVSSGMARRAAAERAAGALESVGLAGLGERLPSELSGGQQQRVAVARALVLEPAVLLFDEPLSNLDARLRRRMRDEIRELQQRLGVTVVYVTHDQSEALAVSDRIVVMRNAEIAQAGAPDDLYERPVDVFVAGFMGEANVLPARVAAIAGGEASVAIGPLELHLPYRGLAVGPASVAVRPEAVRIGPPGTGLAGMVARATYMGAVMEYTIDTALGAVFVVSGEVGRTHAAGESVGLTLAGRGVVLVRP
ncbi:MAG: ABC transporter ATP-binding protein [Alphaproteobacteria bacterium]|nr:ABC transporter ATP-binding protein [Alphaproteobacteria bacterium]